MMALDGKAIKEEIPDKDAYDARKVKAGKEQCRTPDSPEGARVVTPRSPQQRSSRNGCSSSPVRNGSSGSITPPPPATPASISTATSASGADNAQKLVKIRRFLGTIVQFGQEISPDVGDRIRSLALSLASNNLAIEDFQLNVGEAAHVPFKANVGPFLRSHIPLLQREISNLARVNKQTSLQYVRTNESSVVEFPHSPNEHTEIFSPNEGAFTSINGLKRRSSDALYDHHSNGSHEWNDYTILARRPHQSMMINSAPHMYAGHPSIFDYQNGLQSHSESLHNQRDDVRPPTEQPRAKRMRCQTEDDDWRNIHSMLSCMVGMVEKTKRALSILQQREMQQIEPDSVAEIRRVTEEKIAEFRRSAEEQVNQVKHQAMVEIHKAANAAEAMLASERAKMEKMFRELSRSSTEVDTERSSPSGPPSQNACWNCGRKASETCSGCNLARYCGDFCQRKDWERHHQACGTLRTTDASTSITPRPSSQSAPLTNGLATVVTAPPK